MIFVWRSWIMVGLTEVFSSLLRILITSNFLLVMKSFGLGLASKDFLSLFRKTFFSWGSGMELIASNKRSCSFVRVLISWTFSSSVDDSWLSYWIWLRFSSEDTSPVSSSEVSMSRLLICSSLDGSRLRLLNFQIGFFNGGNFLVQSLKFSQCMFNKDLHSLIKCLILRNHEFP